MEIYLRLNIETSRKDLNDAGLFGVSPMTLADGIERVMSVMYPAADKVEVEWSEVGTGLGIRSVDEVDAPPEWDRDVLADLDVVTSLLLRAWGGEGLTIEGEVVEEVVLDSEEPDGLVWAREAYY